MLDWWEHLPDSVKAALVTGSVQVVTGSLTAFVAWYALSSWRRNALGSRQIQLAEECLQLLWTLDDEVKAARKVMVPQALTEATRFKDSYEQNRLKALDMIRSCFNSAKRFDEKVRLAEVYLGKFPSLKLPNTARTFRIPYSTSSEYLEVLERLISLVSWKLDLSEYSKDVPNDAEIEEFSDSINMFSGFIYEYEEDDYSFRLRLSKMAFEHHISSILRRNTRYERIYRTASFRFAKKFKPTMKSRYKNIDILDQIKIRDI